MANIRHRGKGWAVQIRLDGHKINFTEDTLEKAEARAAWVEDRIKKGGLPEKYRQKNPPTDGLGKIIRLYMDEVKITPDDVRLLKTVALKFGATKNPTYDWAVEVIDQLKQEGLAPGTIRKYVGATARALDWAINREYLDRNPLRRLPKNYSAGSQKEDQVRDRRLQSDEEARLRRLLESDPTWHEYLLMFDLALETAMRMREIYTLGWEQIDIDKRTIFLEKTKNGDKRQVPMTTKVATILSPKGRGQIFTLWDGNLSPEGLRNTTSTLSKWWQRAFKKCEIEDFRFHDLRHEATSRLFEKTDLDYVEIAKITGHKSTVMLMRYANLRGSNLADRLW